MQKRAVVFAGQGAQAVGMGKDLAQAYPACAALFSKANEVLGYDLAKLCFEGPIEELTKTVHCQPAIFVVSVACYRALEQELGGLVPVGVAGLSLGEWSALHVAGCLTFEDALRVLAARGRLMQDACDRNQGGMLSVIGLTMDALRRICAETGVEIANLNSPEQTVLSGPKTGIAAAEAKAKEAGAKKAIVLNVAGAYHSSLMASAGAGLQQALAGIVFQAPRVPVIANVTGQPHGAADQIRETMVKQVTSSVQWVTTVEWFRANGVKEYIECGPGKVLGGLVKRIDSEATAHSIQDLASLQKAVPVLKG